MIYVPNAGELEMLKSILASQGLILGLYSNPLSPDGNTSINNITELLTGGGRGYAPFTLTNDLVLGSQVADKWALATDINGKATGNYHNTSLQWVFNSADVADGATAYGVFGYSWVLPFDTGGVEIKVGDVIKGVSSGATGIVTGIIPLSGTWAGGTKAGELRLITKTGTFQDGENITIMGAIGTIAVGSAGGASYAVGDIITVTQTNGSGAKLVVSSVNTGAVTGLVLVDPGTGYTVANGVATTKVTGSGDNALTVNISALATTAYAKTNTDTNADAYKKVLFVDPFYTPQPITPVGFTIQYPAAISLSTA